MNEQANGKERISLRELARRLDRSPSWIHALKVRGTITFGPDGKISEAVARVAIAAARDPAKFHPREAPSPGSFQQERTKRESVTVRLLELDFLERTGALVDAQKVRTAQFELARQVRDRMLVIPDRLSALLAAETDQAKVREILAREIRQALSGAIESEEAAAVDVK